MTPRSSGPLLAAGNVVDWPAAPIDDRSLLDLLCNILGNFLGPTEKYFG